MIDKKPDDEDVPNSDTIWGTILVLLIVVALFLLFMANK
tara:strand:+ start:395 stop:511 length:117 start_codon:yes stop_codon:yes gene_type:complete